MHIWELFEGVNAPDQEVYHWTDAQGLRSILNHDCIDVGASTHRINGEIVYGVSVSRNPYFDISHTFAVAGRKAWRIGLNLQRLRQSFRVLPMRDERYRGIPRTQSFYHPIRGHTSSDEMEEYVLGDIKPLSRFITSLAVEDRYVDPTLHPIDAYLQGDGSEVDPETPDQVLLFDILAEHHPELLEPFRARGRQIQWDHVPLPDDLPLSLIQRDVPRVIPFVQGWEFLLRDNTPLPK